MLLALALVACDPADEPAVTATFQMTLVNTSSPGDLAGNDVSLAPGMVIVHDAAFALFTPGEPVAVDGVEALAEDGDPAELEASLADDPAVSAVVFLRHLDEVTYEAAAMEPGDSGVTQFEAADGQFITVAFMFGQSDDVLVATGEPVAAFEAGTPQSGDWTPALGLWDMGTEVNQEPGVGPDQAPRQASPGDGEAEDEPVTAIVGTDSAGFAYPAVSAFAQLTVTLPTP
jgi:hypothetical protein